MNSGKNGGKEAGVKERRHADTLLYVYRILQQRAQIEFSKQDRRHQVLVLDCIALNGKGLQTKLDGTNNII